MKSILVNFVLASFFLNIFAVYAASEVSLVATIGGETNKNGYCPFVYDDRRPEAQYGLINCTWYSENACCMRTEVTAVFSKMLSLDTPDSMDPAMATKCRNLINYMMCYFCDPEQAQWYTTKLRICEGYCTDTYTHCAQAAYDGVPIGTEFASGNEFCEAQKFEIVSGEDNCFKFNPDVFSYSAPSPRLNRLIMTMCALASLLVLNNNE